MTPPRSSLGGGSGDGLLGRWASVSKTSCQAGVGATPLGDPSAPAVRRWTSVSVVEDLQAADLGSRGSFGSFRLASAEAASRAGEAR